MDGPDRVKETHHVKDYLRLLMEVARVQAVKVRLPADWVEDCTISFAEKLFVRQMRSTETPDLLANPAFLHRCAHNHAIDLRRQAERRACHEESLFVVELDHGPHAFVSLKACRDPEIAFLRAELVVLFVQALGTLKEDRRVLLLRHHIDGEPIDQIARSLNLAPQAVSQRLYRTRQTLRSYLFRHGLSEMDALSTLNG